MKINVRDAFLAVIILSCIAIPARLMGQAAAGPLSVPPQTKAPHAQPVIKPKPPEVTPRTTLDGAWKLNNDESDDPRTKIQDSRGTKAGSDPGGGGSGRYPGGSYPGGGGYPGGGYPGGGYPGGGYPGGGYPGGGGGNGRGNSGRDTETDERLEQLVRPSRSLSFAIKSADAEVEVTDEHYNKLALFTDGRKLQKPKEDSYQEIAAHWEGTRLVTDEKTPQGSKMSRTFELSVDGRQFFETLHIDRGKSKGLLTIRYVYDVLSASAPPDHKPDPDQPVMKRHTDSTANAPSTQGAQPSQAPDPDQPVMKRHADNGNSSSQ
jgi:hypothetical protein